MLRLNKYETSTEGAIIFNLQTWSFAYLQKYGIDSILNSLIHPFHFRERICDIIQYKLTVQEIGGGQYGPWWVWRRKRRLSGTVFSPVVGRRGCTGMGCERQWDEVWLYIWRHNFFFPKRNCLTRIRFVFLYSWENFVCYRLFILSIVFFSVNLFVLVKKKKSNKKIKNCLKLFSPKSTAWHGSFSYSSENFV